MELDSLRRQWEAFGREDPLWAVLTSPERMGGRWDLDEFLATGIHEVSSVLDELDALGLPSNGVERSISAVGSVG